MAYLKQGRNEEALAELQKSVEMTNRSSRSVGFVGYTYGIMGKRNEALAIIKELEDKYAKREGIGQHVAAVYSGLGDREQALAWLEKDFQAHSGELIKIKWYPPFEPLHSDPRFKDLLRRIGLPE